MAAVDADSTHAVELLLGAGADQHTRCKGHNNASSVYPLVHAARKNRVTVMKVLLAHHGGPGIAPSAAALMAAVEAGQHEAATALLDHGCDPNGEAPPLAAGTGMASPPVPAQGVASHTPLVKAVGNRDNAMVALLVAAGALVDAPAAVEAGTGKLRLVATRAPLLKAIADRNLAMVELLLDMGASLEPTTATGACACPEQPPAHFPADQIPVLAARHNEAIVELLVRRGASLHVGEMVRSILRACAPPLPPPLLPRSTTAAADPPAAGHAGAQPPTRDAPVPGPRRTPPAVVPRRGSATSSAIRPPPGPPPPPAAEAAQVVLDLARVPRLDERAQEEHHRARNRVHPHPAVVQAVAPEAVASQPTEEDGAAPILRKARRAKRTPPPVAPRKTKAAAAPPPVVEAPAPGDAAPQAAVCAALCEIATDCRAWDTKPILKLTTFGYLQATAVLGALELAAGKVASAGTPEARGGGTRADALATAADARTARTASTAFRGALESRGVVDVGLGLVLSGITHSLAPKYRAALALLVDHFPDKVECSVCCDVFAFAAPPSASATTTAAGGVLTFQPAPPPATPFSPTAPADPRYADRAPVLPCVQRQHSDRFKKATCSHVACRACLKGWVKSRLNGQHAVIGCMHTGCNVIMYTDDVKAVAGEACAARHVALNTADHRVRLLEMMLEGVALTLTDEATRCCPRCRVVIHR